MSHANAFMLGRYEHKPASGQTKFDLRHYPFSRVILACFVLFVLPVVPSVTSKQHLINQEVCMQPILHRSMDVFQHDVGKST